MKIASEPEFGRTHIHSDFPFLLVPDPATHGIKKNEMKEPEPGPGPFRPHTPELTWSNY